MSCTARMRPFPASTTQRGDCQITLRRMQSQSAVNMQPAGSGSIERADKARRVAQRFFEFEADTAPETVENAVCGLLCGLENPRGEVEGEAGRHAGFEDRGQVGRRPLGFPGFSPGGRKTAFGSLPISTLRRLRLQMSDDACVPLSPGMEGLKGEGDGAVRDRGGERDRGGSRGRRGSNN